MTACSKVYKQQMLHCVFGYIRESEESCPLSKHVPLSLKHVMVKYFNKREGFESINENSEFGISDDKKTALLLKKSSHSKKRYNALRGINVIQSGRYDINIKIHTMKSGLHFGLCSLKVRNKIIIGRSLPKTKNYYYTLSSSGYVLAKVYDEEEHKWVPGAIEGKFTNKLKEGDSVMMRVDVEQQKLSFVLNGNETEKQITIRKNEPGYCVMFGMMDEGDCIKIIDDKWSPRS